MKTWQMDKKLCQHQQWSKKMILRYLKEALELRRQAKNLAKAEKRLEKSELDYLMLENIIKGTNREIVIKLANGTTLTVREAKNETGYVSFNDKYTQAHK